MRLAPVQIRYADLLPDRLGELVGLCVDSSRPTHASPQCLSVCAYFSLTLDSLLTRIILPERDRPVFLTMMQEKLGLSSTQEQIADRL